MPRNTGPGTPAAWKNENHTIMVWLMWFSDADHDPDIDINFAGLVDAVMDALRTCIDPAVGINATDPFTGRQSVIINVGEEMSYDITTMRSTADQRIELFQAGIRVPVLELIQA
jgi:hypothetical protein